MKDVTDRIHVVVLFGGRSAEHDVSVRSATNIVSALDRAKFDIIPVFVTHEGRWLLSRFEGGRLCTPTDGTEVCVLPGGYGRAILIPPGREPHAILHIDVLFPVLHGLHGEDGAVQGFSEIARVPFVGCGIFSSAAALDKDIAKRLIKEAGLPVARAVVVNSICVPSFSDIEEELGLPFFVKPARQGSSIGVCKVCSADELEGALREGFKYDRKLLAEEFIRGREIEYGVLEAADDKLLVSRAGEIVPASGHDFYTFDAKYTDKHGAALNVPADIPSEIELNMRDAAAKAFRTLSCEGMARVDFFLLPDMRFVINEINTIPGFTNVSMFSRVMAASGVGFAELVERLIEHGLRRAKEG